jgi:hypothetical protein
MEEKTLVLFGKNYPDARGLWLVKKANEVFSLGVGRELNQVGADIESVRRCLGSPNLGDAQSLLYVALERRSATGVNGPQGTEPEEVRIWRHFGQPEIAEVFRDWYALADCVEVEMRYPGSVDEHPVISNMSDIKREIAKLDTRLDPLVEAVGARPEDIPAIVCDYCDVELRTQRQFREYWVNRIMNSSGFANFAPEIDEDGRPIDEPFGWLTKRYVKALKTNGYIYRFSFWEEPDGDTRGDLWIQTDRGPLVVRDQTDSVSLKSNFPVQVSSLSGKKLFKLREVDVDQPSRPKGLMARLFG